MSNPKANETLISSILSFAQHRVTAFKQHLYVNLFFYGLIIALAAQLVYIVQQNNSLKLAIRNTINECDARKNELLKEVEFEREQRKKFCNTDVATQEKFSSGSGSSSTALSENQWAAYVNHVTKTAQEEAKQNCDMVCNLKLDNRESTTKLDCHENVSRREKECDERCESKIQQITLEIDKECKTQIVIQTELAVLKKEREVEKMFRSVFDDMLKNKTDVLEAACRAEKVQIKKDKDTECQKVCQLQVSGAEVKTEYSTNQQCRFAIEEAVNDKTEQLEEICKTQIDIANRKKDDQCKELIEKNVLHAEHTAEAYCRKTTEIALKTQDEKMSAACDVEIKNFQKLTYSETARKCEDSCRANKDQKLKDLNCEVESFLRTILDAENDVKTIESGHWSPDKDVIKKLDVSKARLQTKIETLQRDCKGLEVLKE